MGVPTSEELNNIIAELNGTSDRAAALVGAAMVENFIEALLSSCFAVTDMSFLKKNVFDHSGPLGTFSSKNTMAYAIGAYGPEYYRDIDLIRKIRNDFAHSLNALSFDTPAIKSRVGAMSGPALWQGEGLKNTVKEEFVQTVAGIGGMLLQEISFYPQAPRKPRLS